ncbi:unnamed protein product [Clavelina lepadiformis]|uniref:Uncharacterized protein n=1 Tax=Clavelina lepadiformis TaxID=159417 RepID=A0ABP0GAZ6_CLALP
MNRSSVLRCGLDLLDNGNFRNVNLTAVGWEALATAINKLPQPNMDSENVSRLYKDLQAAHTSAKAFTIKKKEASPRVGAKINGMYRELLDVYLSQGDIADGNLERQEYETTHRELTDRLVAVPDVSDCRPMSIHSDASSVRIEQLRSKVNLRAAEPPSRRPNASTKHDKVASPRNS